MAALSWTLRCARLGLAAAWVLLLTTSLANASTLTIGLDIEFSGATAPSGPTPWLVAEFDDSFGDANTVRLTLTAPNLSGQESVVLWYFNFDPSLDPTFLTFTVVDNSASVPNAILTGRDAFMADGDGRFDILFDFPPPPGGFLPRFTAGETVVYHIHYISPIDVGSFNFPNAEGSGFESAAHVQAIGDGSQSGWVGNSTAPAHVPEPGSGPLIGLGLLGLVLRRRHESERLEA